MREWSIRQWGTALGAAALASLVLGIPTDVIPNPLFGRPEPVTWWAPLQLAVSAILIGLIAATYVTDNKAPRTSVGVGGILSFFAIGCPVCNQLVVLALGTSGALQYFAPIQPIIAIGSTVLLGIALRGRLRGAQACQVELT